MNAVVASVMEEPPVRPTTRSPATKVWEERFERRLADWDRHVASCPICLVDGTTLCFEGEHLAELVGEARERLAVAELDEARALHAA